MPRFDIQMLLAGRYHEWLVNGLVTTLELAVLAYILALLLGVLVTALRIAPFKPLQWLMFAYVEFHRNTPALVQLFLWYFGIGAALPHSWQLWINQHNGEFIFAVIALGMCISAYISEDIRSGIRSIPKTQQEAARAIGFGFLGAFAYIVLPQAMRISMPALFNRALLMVKNSSLAMAVGVGELIYQARQVEAMSFRVYEAFAFVTVCYLVVTLSIMAAGRWYERATLVRR